MFTHSGTDYTVTQLHQGKNSTLDRTTVNGNGLLLTVTDGELPDGTVLNVDGQTLTVGTDSEFLTVGKEQWDFLDLGISLNWVEDGEITVSLKLAPPGDDATVPDDWPLIPAGLGVGDSFRLIFMSSTKRVLTSTDIADYNTFVQNRAAAGHADIQDYSSLFKVVGSTATVDARDNTGTTYTTTDKGVPIYWLGGAKVADEYEDFYDGSWDDEANDKTESGTNGPDTSSPFSPLATGSDHDGTEFIEISISRALGASEVRLGRPNSSSSGYGPLSSPTIILSSNSAHIYGLSGVLTVVAALPSLTIQPASATEGSPVQFQVTLSQASTTDVTVRYSTSIEANDTTSNDPTDPGGVDFTSVSNHTLTIPAGQTTGAISVGTGDDSTDENDETFTVTLSNPTEATLGTPARAKGTITDNDEPPSVQVVISQNSEFVGTSISFQLSEVSGKPISIRFKFEPSGEHPATPDDFTIEHPLGLITFDPGIQEKTLVVEYVDDDLDEYDETYQILLTGSLNVTIPTGQEAHTIRIFDNDSSPYLSVADARAGEGQDLEFVVTLSPVSGRDVSVTYSLRPGTATAGDDYTEPSGSTAITIPAGMTTATILVPTIVDNTDEGSGIETMTVRLSTPQSANIARGTATGAITDIIPPGITRSTHRLDLAEDGSATFTVQLATEPTHAVQVEVASSDTGAATVSPATLDFTTTGWDTPQTVTVLGVDDADLGNESITVSLTASSTDTDYEGKTNSVAVAVTDDDTPAVIISPTALDIDEGSSATYTVALRTQPSGEVVIEWRSLAQTDLSIEPSLLIFTTSDWETPKTFTVTAGHDTDKLDDANTITHTATGGGGYGGLTVPSVLVRVIDDDKTVPGTPGNLLAAAGSGEVVLSWQPPGDDGGHPITGYQVRQDGGAWAATGSAVPGYTVTGLTNGTQYAFRVRARNTLGAGADAGPVSATPQELAAPANFRVINATLVNGVYEADSYEEVQLKWTSPQGGFGHHLTQYWVRPGYNNCPRGRDGGRNQTPIDGPCPLLTLYTQYTGNAVGDAGYLDTHSVGGLTYVYRIQAYQEDETLGTANDRTFGAAVEITVTLPDRPPFVPTASTGLTLSSGALGRKLTLAGNWDDIDHAPAYIMQVRKTGQTFNTDPTGSRSYIQAWSGPQLNGADGNFHHSPARSYYTVRARDGRYHHTLAYDTLYYVRVGTCLTVDCDLSDAAFTPERSIRTRGDPN